MIATQLREGSIYGGEQCIDITPKYPYAAEMAGVSYVHGAGSRADYCLSRTGEQGARTNVVSSVFPGVAGDNGGTHTWGNDVSIARLGGYLQRLNGRADTNGDYALIGDSMGGLISLVYAAQATVKPKAIVMVIPVINPEDIRANNRAGYAASINAAYGGFYNEATLGATKNPHTMRAAAKLAGIPMLIFYGLTDTLCLPQWVEEFAAADPDYRELVALPSGHDFDSYNAVDHQQVLRFLSEHLRG